MWNTSLFYSTFTIIRSMNKLFLKSFNSMSEYIRTTLLIIFQTDRLFLRDLIARSKGNPFGRIYKQMVDLTFIFNWLDRIVITLVGAGRGPLILCSLHAAAKAKKDIVIYAIEKNPNAIITLQSLSRSLHWGEKVKIVETDMRVYAPTHYSDIILSELLGSFGDNELSVECLFGTQRFLHQDGVYIPRDCTSYLACCMSSRIYNNVISVGLNSIG